MGKYWVYKELEELFDMSVFAGNKIEATEAHPLRNESSAQGNDFLGMKCAWKLFFKKSTVQYFRL